MGSAHNAASRTKCAHNAPWETTENSQRPFSTKRRKDGWRQNGRGGGGNEPAALHPAGGGGIAPLPALPLLVGDEVLSAMPLSFAVSMMAR